MLRLPHGPWLLLPVLGGCVGLSLSEFADWPLDASVTVRLSDFADWPINSSGFEIEELPVVITASYARGDDVYLGLPNGAVYKASDSSFAGGWTSLGNPLGVGPRLLFASGSGVVFASADQKPMLRTVDSGAAWEVCLGVSVWRMDEDELGNLYAGNYTQDDQHVATVYKSTDGGVSWTPIWSDRGNRHVHTVRWDPHASRLYIAFGDGPMRGRAYSDDRGGTFHDIARHYHDGPTDVAFTRAYIWWCSDDGSGRLLRVSRATGAGELYLGRSQYLWFAVAAGEQVYVGTVTSDPRGGERAALLASCDQGTTWQKLLETEASTGPYSRGFAAESRELSAAGWLYCGSGASSYRVRFRPPGVAAARPGSNRSQCSPYKQ